jgi:hypothetical protein
MVRHIINNYLAIRRHTAFLVIITPTYRYGNNWGEPLEMNAKVTLVLNFVIDEMVRVHKLP